MLTCTGAPNKKPRKSTAWELGKLSRCPAQNQPRGLCKGPAWKLASNREIRCGSGGRCHCFRSTRKGSRQPEDQAVARSGSLNAGRIEAATGILLDVEGQLLALGDGINARLLKRTDVNEHRKQ